MKSASRLALDQEFGVRVPVGHQLKEGGIMLNGLRFIISVILGFLAKFHSIILFFMVLFLLFQNYQHRLSHDMLNEIHGNTIENHSLIHKNVELLAETSKKHSILILNMYERILQWGISMRTKFLIFGLLGYILLLHNQLRLQTEIISGIIDTIEGLSSNDTELFNRYKEITDCCSQSNTTIDSIARKLRKHQQIMFHNNLMEVEK